MRVQTLSGLDEDFPLSGDFIEGRKKPSLKRIAKGATKGLKAVTKKVAKVGKTAALLAPRNAFLALTRLNVGGLATSLSKKLKSNPTKLHKWWRKFGGSTGSLDKAIRAGSKKKALAKIGFISVAATAATAAPLLAAYETLKKEFPKETGDAESSNLAKKGLNAFGRAVNSKTGKRVSKGRKTLRKLTSVKNKVKKPKPKKPAEASTGTENKKASGVNTKLLLGLGIGAAALYALNN